MAENTEEAVNNQPAAPAPVAAVPATDSPTDIIHFEKWLGILGERAASDLHLTVGNVPLLRLDGKITPLLDEDIITAERLERIAASLLSEEEMAELRQNKEIILSRTLKKIMRFRAHIFYSHGFLVLSMRYLPAIDFNFVQLGIPNEVAELTKAAAGLIIVTGPFDAGKTTTVHTFLSAINNEAAKYIITLEKPVEYLLTSAKSAVVQREVGHDVKDFADGLAGLLDEDVDVVAVSAIEDPAEIKELLTLANTGRLVVAVGNARHAIGALEEWRDAMPVADRPRLLGLLSEALLAVVGQALLPKVGGGRILISEILRATNPVKALVRDDKLRSIASIMQTSRQEGMVTMDRALADAVKNGQVTIESARAHAIDPNQFNILVSH